MSNVVVPPPGTPVPTGGVPLSGTFTANWQNDILTLIGAPLTAGNQEVMNAWNACEGNNPLPQGSGIPINNPFNTTLTHNGKGVSYGGKGINSANVQAYPTASIGIQATVDTMLNTPAFAPIVAALRNNAGKAIIAGAIGASGWGTSGNCIAKNNGKVAAGAVFPGDPADTSGTPAGPGSGGDLGQAVPSSPIPLPNALSSWSGLVGGLQSILSALTSLSFWARVGQGMLGTTLIIAGLVFILSETKGGKEIAGSLGTMAEGAAV